MPKTAYIRIRINTKDKKDFKAYAEKEGRDMTELIIDFIKQTIRNGKK